jgi:hypothetical protein
MLLVPTWGTRSPTLQDGAPIHRVRAHSLTGIRITYCFQICIHDAVIHASITFLECGEASRELEIIFLSMSMRNIGRSSGKTITPYIYTLNFISNYTSFSLYSIKLAYKLYQKREKILS